MIPVGILNQGSRDLSKEIWISWGDGYAQEGGVYVNTVDYTGQIISNLLNAKGDPSGFSFNMVNWNSGAGLEDAGAGDLDIINRNTLVLQLWDDSYSQIDISSATTNPVEVYVLKGRTNGLSLNYYGWGAISTAIPPSLSPIQEYMDISDDWYKLDGSTYPNVGTLTIVSGLDFDYGRIRAIVIKLL